MKGPGLPKAFGLSTTGELVAIVGGGGKSTLLFSLAAELPGRVVMTTTTRIFASQMNLAPATMFLDEKGAFISDVFAGEISRHGRLLVVGRLEGQKALGVPVDLPAVLLRRADVDHVLIEADGSRGRPCKAPDVHEPVIPLEASVVVPMAGIDALENRIGDVAHRPELVARLTGLTVDRPLRAVDLAALLGHPEGGLKGIPPAARAIPFINKIESPGRLAAAREIASSLLGQARIERVLLGALQSPSPVVEVHRRVTAVVLAAGRSTRMGQVKQKLAWGQRTMLGQTLQNLSEALLFDRVVVSGHEAEAIQDIAREFGLPTIHNPDYAAGEMLSSLQAAVRSLPADRSAVLVVLADQPMVRRDTLSKLLEAFWRMEGEILAPVYKGVRGNPVLIGRAHFPELLGLGPGAAPRDLLARHPGQVRLVEVDDEAVLRDIDSWEQYERWRPKGESPK